MAAPYSLPLTHLSLCMLLSPLQGLRCRMGEKRKEKKNKCKKEMEVGVSRIPEGWVSGNPEGEASRIPESEVSNISQGKVAAFPWERLSLKEDGYCK